MTAITKAGRYELLEELGRGAMGVVYRASDPVIGRTVAVKTIRVTEHSSGLSQQELLRRFHTEARAAGLLSHPNIVSVYDAGKEDDFFYITMELVEGKSLDDLLGQRHAFPLARVLRILQQSCSALDFAHQHNVVHRDIKPANLILTPDDNLKISDFGTAKILQFQTAQTGQIVGTPSYMSPEQIKGRPVDGRSDIFSLGAVLYELLTGQKPFAGDTITAVIYKIVSEEPVAPRDLDHSIHPGLSAIVMRALAKAPNVRFQSCCQFFDALQNYRNYQPGSAPLPLPESPDKSASESGSSFTMPPPALMPPPEPVQKSGSAWLALFLLAVIGAAGYKVWPPLHELWLRTQPEPIAVLPKGRLLQRAARLFDNSTGSTAVTDAAKALTTSSVPSAASLPVPPAPAVVAQEQTPRPVAAAVRSPGKTATPEVTAVPEAKKPVVVAPAVATAAKPAVKQPSPATVAARAPVQPALAKPSASPAAAAWKEHVVNALADAGLVDKVRVIAAGSTVTVAGRLDLQAHRTLLSLLQGSPSDVQVVDHIEDTGSPAPER
jgi:serine/threonine protein kinase